MGRVRGQTKVEEGSESVTHVVVGVIWAAVSGDLVIDFPLVAFIVWRLMENHLIEGDSEAPDINVVCVWHLLDKLRSHVEGRATAVM